MRLEQLSIQILEETLKDFNNKNFSDIELAQYMNHFFEICREVGDDVLMEQRILFYFCNIFLERQHTNQLAKHLDLKLKEIFHLKYNMNTVPLTLSDWRNMLMLFSLHFVKDQFEQFQINHTYMSQFQSWVNYFTCRKVEMDTVSRLLEFLPDMNFEQNKAEKFKTIEFIFSQVTLAINEIIENEQTQFTLRQFELLENCQQFFKTMTDVFHISLDNYEFFSQHTK